MITDEQFIAAMEQAVKDKGEDHQASATFWNSWANSPSCMVGYALWTINHDACPRDNKHNADVVLPSLGVSYKVAKAGLAAQYLNDMGFTWGQVMDGFRYALKLGPENSALDVVELVRIRMNRIRALNRSQAPKTPVSTMAKGGMITSGTIKSISFSTAAMGSFTVSSEAASLAFASLAEQFAKVELSMKSTMPVLQQKDHALTA